MKNIIKKIGSLLLMITLFTSVSFAEYIPKYEEFAEIDMDIYEGKFKIYFEKELDMSNDNVSAKNIYVVDEDFDKSKYKDYIWIDAGSNHSISLNVEKLPFENNKIYYICIDKNILMNDGTQLGVDIQNPFKLDSEYGEVVKFKSEEIEKAIRKELNLVKLDRELTKGDLTDIKNITLDDKFNLADLGELSLLNRLDKIRFENYDFTNAKEFDYNKLDLELVNCKIDNLNIFKNIYGLTLDNCEINNWDYISNINFLWDFKLLNMDLTKYNLDELFKNTGYIEEFHLVNCKVNDIKFISNLEGLIQLYIRGDIAVDCNDIVKCKQLQDIDFEYTNLKNIDKLSTLKDLICLSISYSELDDNKLNELCEKKKSFDYLELTNCNLKNMDFINSLESLRTLNISNNQIKNINSLAELKILRDINVSNNKLENIYALVGFKNCFYLDISNNNLKSMKELKEINKLKTLNISNNPIENINDISDFNDLIILDISKDQNDKFKTEIEKVKNINININ